MKMTIVNSALKGLNVWMSGVKLENTANFHPLEVVGRGSETQLQVGENLNKIPWRVKGQPWQLFQLL